MKIYTITRTFFDGSDNWEQTVTADSYKVLAEAKNAMFGIIQSLIDAGVEYIGTFTFEYLENTQKKEDLHATLEYPNGRMEIIAIQENWLY